MLSAIAIDDEPIALDIIKELAAGIDYLNITATFTNAFMARQFLTTQKTDLVFLDIKMPDISGIDLLQSIDQPPMVIFTTAYSEHAVQSFELEAIDYLLKPFSKERFLKACKKAWDKHILTNLAQEHEPQDVFIRSESGQVRVNLQEVLYIESCGNYMQFVLENNKIMSRITMKETEVLLPPAEFIRVHRSFIISKKKVSRIEKNTIWVKSHAIPVGGNYIEKIARLMGHTG